MAIRKQARLLYLNMQKEKVPCNLCGSEDHALIFDQDRYGMGLSTVMCRRCGFLFTNPRPTQKAMNDFYKETYRLFYTGNPPPYKEYRDRLTVSKRQWLYERVKPKFDEMKLRAPGILDVGCGSGVLLHVFRKNLPQSRLYGIEPFPYYARFAEKKNSALVYCGDVNTFIHEQRRLLDTFDLITLYHVLEHLYNPVDTLRKLQEFLSPNGMLLVQVPNAASPHFTHLARMCHIAHVNHFTPTTLKNAFLLSGFNVVKFFASQHPGNPTAMTFLGFKNGHGLSREDLKPLPLRETEAMLRELHDKTLLKRIPTDQKKPKPRPTLPSKWRGRLRRIYTHLKKIKKSYGSHGPSYSFDKALGMLKRAGRGMLGYHFNLLRKAYGRVTDPIAEVHRHARTEKVLRGLIQGKKILIIGSGPSASQLDCIPEGVLLFTCNAGLRLVIEKGAKRRVDLFLCRKKAMTEDYTDIAELLAAVQTDVFVMDNLASVKSLKELNGAYSRLIQDYQKDNYYFQKLIAPLKIDELKLNSVTWTSAGVRLLQYALYFGAKEIYLIGIDLSNTGYFWGDRFRHTHPTDKMKHKHPIDHNFLKLVAKKYKNVFSLSTSSPITRYLPYKNPWSPPMQTADKVLLQETTEQK